MALTGVAAVELAERMSALRSPVSIYKASSLRVRSDSSQSLSRMHVLAVDYQLITKHLLLRVSKLTCSSELA